MIIGADREQVIQNIKKAANARDFTAKVEVGDPVMTLDESKRLVSDFWKQQNSLSGKLNDLVGHTTFAILAKILTASAEFKGTDKLKNLPQGGAIITANHFYQFDPMRIERLTTKMHHKLLVLSEDTNLKLPGFLGYLMNYAGVIPLVKSPNYIGLELPKHLHDALAKNYWVLIFPEQEMWWNYRKPRKLQRGAYYFAAKQNVPVISTFVEIRTLPKLEKNHPDFYQTKCIIHVLPTIYPDVTLNLRQNSKQMMAKDYQQKVATYEKIYGKKLNYDFTPWDIAGWRNKVNEDKQ